MKIGDIVHFQKKNFFNGAVQLSWVAQQPSLAAEVATAFVFHGPKYHGGNDADHAEIKASYRLKDTASFLVELLSAIDSAHAGGEINPFWLAVELSVIDSTPQSRTTAKKRTPESVLDDFPSHHGGDSERFRLTVDLFSDYIWSCKGGWI